MDLVTVPYFSNGQETEVGVSFAVRGKFNYYNGIEVKHKIGRLRSGNGFWGSVPGKIYQDIYEAPSYVYQNTPAQEIQRNKFKAGMAAWKALPPSVQQFWNDDIVNTRFTFGRTFFMHEYMLLMP